MEDYEVLARGTHYRIGRAEGAVEVIVRLLPRGQVSLDEILIKAAKLADLRLLGLSFRTEDEVWVVANITGPMPSPGDLKPLLEILSR